ncbi:MAG: hypothetical protein ACYSSI_09800 [Planctomycetota bacterium]|jgi:hypothetical protein
MSLSLEFEALAAKFERQLSKEKLARYDLDIEETMKKAGKLFHNAIESGQLSFDYLPPHLRNPPKGERTLTGPENQPVERSLSYLGTYWWCVVTWLSLSYIGSGISIPGSLQAEPKNNNYHGFFAREVLPSLLGYRTAKEISSRWWKHIVTACADACHYLASLSQQPSSEAIMCDTIPAKIPDLIEVDPRRKKLIWKGEEISYSSQQQLQFLTALVDAKGETVEHKTLIESIHCGETKNLRYETVKNLKKKGLDLLANSITLDRGKGYWLDIASLNRN